MTTLGGTTLFTTSSTTLNTPIITSSNKTNNVKKPANKITPTGKKKVNESAITLKIKKIQEEKRLFEEAEQKRAQEVLLLEQEELAKEKLKRKEQAKHQLLAIERNKVLEEKNRKQAAFNKSIAKYGYNPIITPTISHKPKHKKITSIIVEEVPEPEQEPTDIIDDWENESDTIQMNVPLIEENKMEENRLKAPVVCVLGSVNAGKTHLLDKIRSSTIHSTEAGNITQQIAASYVDASFLHEDIVVPGLIFIDTPGHEPFISMRTRATGLCDVAILMVDLLVGVQKQTLECIRILQEQQKVFVIALNKVDLLYNYNVNKGLLLQEATVIMEFNDRVRFITVQFQELGINVKLYHKHGDDYINMVPISAITGEGIKELLVTVAKTAPTLIYTNDIVCTVLEVTNMVGHGTTIDVILTNGTLSKGDCIVLCNLQGGIITTHIKSILTYHFMNRKGSYVQNNSVIASTTCRIDAPGLEDALAGSALYVITKDSNIDDYKRKVLHTFTSWKDKLKPNGVYICASSLGALEALFDYLTANDIDIGGFKLGSVSKKDVMMAKSYMIVFGIIVAKEVKEYASSRNVMIFEHDIIYKLFDAFITHINKIKLEERKVLEEKVIYPCILSILSDCIYNRESPIIVGVHVDQGVLRRLTPIFVNGYTVGRVKSIEKNNKALDEAVVGDNVCIMIEQSQTLFQYSYGRHFTHSNLMYSKITKESIHSMQLLHPTMVDQYAMLIEELKSIL